MQHETVRDRGAQAGLAGWALFVGLLLIVGGVVQAWQHHHAGPSSFVMPNFEGKNCAQSQAAVDRLVRARHGVYPNEEAAGDSTDGCYDDAVVIRTSPSAGATVSLTSGSPVRVEWWAIKPDAYRWYRAHPRMPNYIGKAFDSNAADQNNSATGDYVTEETDYSLITNNDSGYYDQAQHLIVSTDPAPGSPLSIGQKITIYTQVQRGRWISLSGGGSSSGGGGDWHVGACVGTWLIHVCS